MLVSVGLMLGLLWFYDGVILVSVFLGGFRESVVAAGARVFGFIFVLCWFQWLF